MAITVVGTPQATSSLNGVDVTLTFSTAPIAGDVVYLWGGHPQRASTNIGPSTAGYTQLVLDTSTNTCSFGVWRKVMGASPDTTVVGQGTGNTADSTGYACIVLRGVNPNTPEDQTSVKTTGSSTNPDPGSITTQTANALVLALAASVVSDNAVGTQTNYTQQASANSNDTNPYTVAGSSRSIAAAGAEDPPAWSAWSTGAWVAVSVAVRQMLPFAGYGIDLSYLPPKGPPLGAITNRDGSQGSTGLLSALPPADTTSILRDPLVTRIPTRDASVAIKAGLESQSSPLALGAVINPFRQAEWPNPQRPRQPAITFDPAALLGGPLTLAAPDSTHILRDALVTPIAKRDPFVALRAGLESASSPVALLAVQAAPFAPQAAQNPQQPRPKQPLGGSHSDLLTTTLKSQDRFFGADGQPPANLDWPNPIRPRQPIVADPPNLLTTTLAPSAADTTHILRDPIRTTIAARDGSVAVRTGSQGSSLETVLGVAQKPFAQSEWPVPKGKTPATSLRTHVEPLKQNLIGQDVLYGAPGEVPAASAPQPRDINVADGIFDQVGVPKTLTEPPPAAPDTDHILRDPLVTKFERRDTMPAMRAGSAGTPKTLIPEPPAGTPFAQNNWPNPVLRIRTGQFEYSAPLSLVGGGQKPFNQTDWPVPPGAKPAVSLKTHLPANLQTTPFTTPPVVDTPVPREATVYRWQGREFPVALRTFLSIPNPNLTGPGSTNVMYGAPGQVPAYYSPQPRDIAFPDGLDPEGTPLTIRSIIPPPPFAQTDWPNPVLRRSRGRYEYAEPLTLAGGGLMPFSQNDWPVPRGAAPKRPRQNQDFGQGLPPDYVPPPVAGTAPLEAFMVHMGRSLGYRGM